MNEKTIFLAPNGAYHTKMKENNRLSRAMAQNLYFYQLDSGD